MELFKPKWMSKNEKKALAAIEKITDQEELKEAVINAPLDSTGLAAIKKVMDQEMLKEIAINAAKEEPRLEALQKMTDETLIAQVAKEARLFEFSLAIQKISDEKLLTDIAINAKATKFPVEDFAWRHKTEVLTKITDEKLIAEIALAYKDKDLLGRITDKEILLDIAARGNKDMARAACDRLCGIVQKEDAKALIISKIDDPKTQNFTELLYKLREFDPDGWTTFCSKETIYRLMSSEYWGEIPKIDMLLWELYKDARCKKLMARAVIEYTKQMQQETEFDIIVEMLFAVIREQNDTDAVKCLQEIYRSGKQGEYIKKRNIKADEYHEDIPAQYNRYFEFSTNQYEDDNCEHRDSVIPAQYYVQLETDIDDKNV